MGGYIGKGGFLGGRLLVGSPVSSGLSGIGGVGGGATENDPFAGILRLQWVDSEGDPVGLYQDVACTIPALTDGDKVLGARDDLSGGTRIFSQATSSLAPTLKIVSGRRVLRFTQTQYLRYLAPFPLPELDVFLRWRIATPYRRFEFISGAGTNEEQGNSVNGFGVASDKTSGLFISRANPTVTRATRYWARGNVASFAVNGVKCGTTTLTVGNPQTGTAQRRYINAGAASNINGVVYGGINCDIERIAFGTGVSDLAAEALTADWTPEIDALRVVCDGDSLTDGSYDAQGVNPGEDYPAQLQLLEPDRLVINRGVWGDRITFVVTRRTEMLGYLRSGDIYILHVGRNDLANGVSGATVWAQVSAHSALMRTGGRRVYICSLIVEAIDGAGTPAAWEAQRQAFNTLLYANYASYADGYIDFAADARLQDATNLTYFQADRVHQAAGGHAVKAELAHAVIG